MIDEGGGTFKVRLRRGKAVKRRCDSLLSMVRSRLVGEQPSGNKAGRSFNSRLAQYIQTGFKDDIHIIIHCN